MIKNEESYIGDEMSMVDQSNDLLSRHKVHTSTPQTGPTLDSNQGMSKISDRNLNLRQMRNI